jgi:predicted AAA+ superfamily ATPase
MFKRFINKPQDSFLLLGPRGTGKSTWLESEYRSLQKFDFLDTQLALKYSMNPGHFYEELKTSKPGTWIIVDEIQKVPSLLDEVHRLIENNKLKFILSGSSARKLKKSSTNLLGGRAEVMRCFPFVSSELGNQFNIQKAIQFGSLPKSFLTLKPQAFLRSYIETYIQQEIIAEAIVKNLGSFSRFLEIAGLQNAQTINITNIARDAKVARPTVQGYFQVLVDTLVGDWLPAWKLKAATKEVSHPKFYFFDSGVARAASGRLPYPVNSEELGFLFETLMFHELKAYMSYSEKNYKLHYWRSHSNEEVDFVFEDQKGYVAIECKSDTQWLNSYNGGLKVLGEKLVSKKVRLLGVYLGDKVIDIGNIKVFPAKTFLKRLWDDQVGI